MEKRKQRIIDESFDPVEFDNVRDAIKSTLEWTNIDNFGKIYIGKDRLERDARDFNIKDLQELIRANMYQICYLLGIESDEVEDD